jgi:hypothetical protein
MPIKARYPINQAQYDAFWADGFLVVPQLIESPPVVPMLHDDSDRAIAGEFRDLKWGNSAKMGQQVQKPVHPGVIPGWDEAFELSCARRARRIRRSRLRPRLGLPT